jgi:hypothetical protein
VRLRGRLRGLVFLLLQCCFYSIIFILLPTPSTPQPISKKSKEGAFTFEKKKKTNPIILPTQKGGGGLRG